MEERKKTALVTGASRGIGRAVSLRLLSDGYDVLAIARSKEALSALTEEAGALAEAKKSGAGLRVFAGDVGDERFVKSVFSELRETDGFSLLINNAGISYVGLLQEMKLAEWNRLFLTNVTGIFLSCREAIPLFLRGGGGSIVNISSVWGNQGASMEAAYSATKGAVNALTRALAKELAPSMIRVNAVAPGVIDTEMNAMYSPDERQALADEIAMGRFGTPEEAAALIVDLATRHPYMTGQVVTLDGGWT